ncbi:hypothetical protein V2J56_09015 [Georgenia sp. MJ206]|uniref:hypothetical protein n=1 Tax=Georgenia wangjunii TaxID=3117730 RepID=UPI002F26A932
MSTDTPRPGDTITTAEALDALPAETVIRTAGFEAPDTVRYDPPRVAVKSVTGDWSVADEEEWSVETDELDDLPATVLYVPGQPVAPSPCEGRHPGDCGPGCQPAAPQDSLSRVADTIRAEVVRNAQERPASPYTESESKAWRFGMKKAEQIVRQAAGTPRPAPQDAATTEAAAEVIFDALTGGDAENFTIADCLEVAEGLAAAGMLTGGTVLDRDEVIRTLIAHPWPDVDGPFRGACPSCRARINAGPNSPAHAEHQADAVLALLPGESRAEVQAQAVAALTAWLEEGITYFSERADGDIGAWWLRQIKHVFAPELAAAAVRAGESR